MLSVKTIKTWCFLCLILSTTLIASIFTSPAGCQTVPTIAPQVHDLVVPITYDPIRTPNLTIYVRINHSEPLPFLLDTGLDLPLLIFDTLQKRFHPKVFGQAKINQVQLPKVHFEAFAFCTADPARDIAFSEDQAEAVVVNKVFQRYERDEHIVGVIGLPLLRAVSPCRLDFATKTLTMLLSEDLSRTMAAANEVALIPNEDGLLHAKVTFNAVQTEDLTFDTSSAETFLIPNTAQKLSSVFARKQNYYGFNDGFTVYHAVVPTVQVGKWSENDVLIATHPSLSTLGVDFLSRYRLTLDAGNNRLFLEKNERYVRPGNRGIQCVEVADVKGKLQVTRVGSDYSPALAAVQVGDEVISVDGTVVNRGAVPLAQRMLDGYERTKAHLVLRRKGQTLNIEYERPSLPRFEPPVAQPVPSATPSGVIAHIQGSRITDLDSNVVEYDPSVKISRDISSNSFPSEWLHAPMSISAEPISREDALRSIAAVRRAFDRYPKPLIDKVLSTVYICKNLSTGKTGFGGIACSQNRSFYINGGGSDTSIESIAHHELAHMLTAYHGGKNFQQKWSRLNARWFRYGNGGFDYIREHYFDGGDTTEEECQEKGFVNQYAMSSVDEDFACTVEFLFFGREDFWSAVEQNKILQDKVKLVMSFYQSIDPSMNEAYFTKIRQAQALVPYPPNTPIPFPYGGYVYYPAPNGGKPFEIKVQPRAKATYPPGGGYHQNPKPDTPEPN